MVDVAAGTYSSFAVSADGRVEAWGLNNYGQLALPATTAAHHTPNVVSGLLDHKIAAIAGGQHHTLAVTAVSIYTYIYPYFIVYTQLMCIRGRQHKVETIEKLQLHQQHIRCACKC